MRECSRYGAAKEGSQVVDQVVSAFRDNAYPGAGLIRLGRVYRNTGSGELKEEDVVSTDVAFKKNLEISLKYDELILQEYAGDVIKVDTANDEKGDVVISEDADKITIKDTHAGTTRTKKQVIVSIPSGTAFDSVSLGVDAELLSCTEKSRQISFMRKWGWGI